MPAMPRENSFPACTQCGCTVSTAETEFLCPVCLFDGLDLPEESDAAAALTPTPERPRSLLPIQGHTVVAELARGGMGVVYRARQWEPEREVALKMLLPFSAASADMRARFQREAQALSALEHPAILPIYGMGEHDGLPWFTMKLATGGNLAERVSALRGRWREIAALVGTLADAVQFAHDRGVLHRDLKPGNILFDEAGQPYVADFGLAKLIHEDAAHTQTALALGTPTYLAPEVAASSAHRGTVASDVYSLGAVLFELLAGHPPFQADGLPALLARIVSEEARFPDAVAAAAIPRDLRVIALRCLAKNPAHRYASARELAEELRRYLGGEPILARPVGAGERLWRWSRRQPALATALAACVVIAIAGAAGVWRQLRQTEAARAVAVQKTEAEQAQRVRAETAQRQAEQSERVMRQNLYAADMLAVQRALAEHDLGTARLLLETHRPPAGQPDLRGFEWRYFWGRAQPGNFLTLAHEGHEVSALAFSPDGASLAYASRQVMVHDTATFQLQARIPMPSTQSFAFVPGMKHVMFLGNREHDVHIWAANAPNPFQIVRPRVGRWPNVAIRPAVGPLVLAVGTHPNFTTNTEGRTVIFTINHPRELTTGGRRQVLPDAGGVVAFSPDGRLLATGSWQGKITLWEPLTGAAVKTLGNARRVISLRFSPDGRTLVACSHDDSAWLFDVESGTQRPVARAHAGRVVDAEISPDGRTLATGATDQTVRLWDMATGRETARFAGHSYTVSRVAWSPDGNVLASGGQDGTVRLWRVDGTAAAEEEPIPGHSSRRMFAPDGRRWVVSHPDGKTALHGYPNLERIAGPNELGRPVGFGRREGESAFFTLRTKRDNDSELARWASTDLRALGATPLAGAEMPLLSPVLSADGGRFAAGLGRGEIGLWDLSSPQHALQRLQLPVPQASTTLALEFSPDGRRLAASFMDSTSVYLWEIAGTPGYRELTGHKGFVTHLLFTADGQTLASADGDKVIKLWSVADGKETGSLLGHRLGVLGLDISSDGRTVASVSGDQTLRLWNLATRREVARFELPVPAHTVAFAPDGTGLLYERRDSDSPRILIHRAPGLRATDTGPSPSPGAP